MNNFDLVFDKTITRAAGYQYGKKVYEEQCKGKIDFDKNITLTFPDNIQKLASSFIQGFFDEIIERIGISGIESRVIVISQNPNMKQEILDNLF